MNETKPQAKGVEAHGRGEEEGGREGHQNQLPPPKTGPVPAAEFKCPGGGKGDVLGARAHPSIIVLTPSSCF